MGDIDALIIKLRKQAILNTGIIKFKGSPKARQDMAAILVYTTTYDESDDEWQEDLQEAKN